MSCGNVNWKVEEAGEHGFFTSILENILVQDGTVALVPAVDREHLWRSPPWVQPSKDRLP